MGVRLNDNFQEALQFLTLGASLILGTRLAYLGGLRLLAPEQSDALHKSMEPFGHGYLLADPDTLVVHSMNAGGRAALALALAIAMAILLALAAAVLASLLRKDALPMAVAGGRSGLLLGALWGLFAALALPPTTVQVSKEGIALNIRPALFGELSLPLPSSSVTIPWGATSTISTRTKATRGTGCGSTEEVFLTWNGQIHVLAQLKPEGRNCAEAVLLAQSQTRSLAAQLDSLAAR